MHNNNNNNNLHLYSTFQGTQSALHNQDEDYGEEVCFERTAFLLERREFHSVKVATLKALS